MKDTKVRLSERTGIKGKQFENVKFAIISRASYSKPHYLTDGMSCQLSKEIAVGC
jgi:ubiquitin carboxyl-terminal hydrolase 7